MKAFKDHLKLIQLVNNNYSHITDLETLLLMLETMQEKPYMKEYPNEFNLTQEQILKLQVICKTTINSHYNYNLYLAEEYKNPDNHVDIIISNLN